MDNEAKDYKEASAAQVVASTSREETRVGKLSEVQKKYIPAVHVVTSCCGLSASVRAFVVIVCCLLAFLSFYLSDFSDFWSLSELVPRTD